MTRGKTLFLLLSLVLLAPRVLGAQVADTVIDDTVKAVIDIDGKTTIEEVILYDFGPARHHGIYRNIPVQAQEGNALRDLGIHDVTVTGRDGATIPFDLSKERGFVRLRIGDPRTLVSGVVEYHITYKADTLMQGYPTFDVWSWNVTSSNWPNVIRRARLSVEFPKEVSVKALTRSCVTLAHSDPKVKETCQIGFLGESASGTTKSMEVMDLNLQPKDPMIVSLAFPKGFMNNIPMAVQKSTQPASTSSPISVLLTSMLLVGVGYGVKEQIGRRGR